MDRNTLIAQVKSEYAAMSVTGGNRPAAFYESLQAQVVNAIEAGRFDGFESGRDIVAAVSGANRQWLDRQPGYF